MTSKQINITNNETTPIDEIIATDALSNDWRWQEQEVQVQLLQADETVMERNAACFEAILCLLNLHLNRDHTRHQNYNK